MRLVKVTDEFTYCDECVGVEDVRAVISIVHRSTLDLCTQHAHELAESIMKLASGETRAGT